ncbi:hypothetical protein LSAT2_002773 [Lamellibrachia satsuma]|nr:hypothetical protein LSAT2_002773 [Lamellibrachia satsuma]
MCALKECEYVIIEIPDDLSRCHKKCRLDLVDCIVDSKLRVVNTVRLNADHGRHFHRLVDHMTKLRYFTKGDIRCQTLREHTRALRCEVTINVDPRKPSQFTDTTGVELKYN